MPASPRKAAKSETKQNSKRKGSDTASGGHHHPQHHQEKGIFSPIRMPISRRLQTLTVWAWVNMLPMSVILTTMVIFLTVGGGVYIRVFDSDVFDGFYTIWAMLLGGYIFHIWIDTRFQRDAARGNRRMESRIGRYWSRKFAEYFPGDLVFDHDDSTEGDDQAFIDKYLAGDKYMSNFSRQEPTNDPYVPRSLLMCYHPHGLFGFGVWANCLVSHGKFFDLIRTRRQPINSALTGDRKDAAESISYNKRPRMFHVVAHTMTMNFFMPVWREFLLFTGCGDVGRQTLLHRLTPRPQEVYEGTEPPAIRVSILVPGGAAEAVDCCEPTLTLLKRKGFIKVALETGAAIVPTFCFGETKTYRPLVNPSRTKRFLHKIQKILHLGTPLVVGRGMFNYKFGLLPHRVPLTLVVGKPIELTRKKKGTYTPAEVDAIHAEYMDRLKDLYRRHVGDYGDESYPRELTLV